MCVSPITIKRLMPDGTTRPTLVPCGKCHECLKSYQNQWSLRLEQECSQWNHVWFLTLTYREDTVPWKRQRITNLTGEIFLTLDKKHLTDHIKRFRTNYERKYGAKPKFKYFACGEYGTKTHRPHYHLLLFTNDPVYKVVDFWNDWNSRYGYVLAKEVVGPNKSGVTRYVTKYCAKGVFEEPLAVRQWVDKTFRIMSKGIGAEFARTLANNIMYQTRTLFPDGIKGDYYGFNKDYFEYLYSMKRIISHGMIYGMPKYWYESIFYHKKEYICEVKDTRKSAQPVFHSDINMWTYPVRLRKEKRYDKNSPFSLAFAAFVREKSAQLLDEKFSQVQAQYPSWKDSKVWSYVYRQDYLDKISRGEEVGSKLASFLLNSQI